MELGPVPVAKALILMQVLKNLNSIRGQPKMFISAPLTTPKRGQDHIRRGSRKLGPLLPQLPPQETHANF